MSDERIFIRFKGKTLGPLSGEKVRGLIRRGQITRMHELSSDGLTWQRAEEFGDFFGQSYGSSNTAIARVSNVGAGSGASTAAASALASVPIPGQMADDGVAWYAHVHGENQGPIPMQKLMQWIASGDVRSDTLVWRAGLDDWRGAAEVLPEHFTASSAGAGSNAAAGSMGGGEAGGDSAGLSLDRLPDELCERFTNQRTWVMILSLLGLVMSGLMILYFITGMIVGAEARWMPLGGSRAVVYGLIGLLYCGLAISGQVLLLNYGNSLKKLQRHPNMLHLGLAASRLHLFWKFAAIVLVVTLILVLGSMILVFVMVAAAAGASS